MLVCRTDARETVILSGVCRAKRATNVVEGSLLRWLPTCQQQIPTTPRPSAPLKLYIGAHSKCSR
jgi:hypothetical protein